MRLQIVAFGRLKTPGMAEAVEHYLKHLKSLADVTVTELKPIPLPDKSPATRRKAQAQEAAILLGKLASSTPLWLLDEKGKPRASLEWGELIRGWESAGHSEVALAVGSSIGFDDSVRERARGLLSLGPQTYPHELARVALLEQLFRGYSILRGHPYHNEGS